MQFGVLEIHVHTWYMYVWHLELIYYISLNLASFLINQSSHFFGQVAASTSHGEPGRHIGQQSSGGQEHPPQLCVCQQERHSHQHTSER